MRVIQIDINCRQQTTDMPNTLEALQNAVGGSIQIVPLTTELCVVCNEEGKVLGLPPVAVVPMLQDILCGSLVICRTDEQGELIDVEDDDLCKLSTYLQPVYQKSPYDMEVEQGKNPV